MRVLEVGCAKWWVLASSNACLVRRIEEMVERDGGERRRGGGTLRWKDREYIRAAASDQTQCILYKVLLDPDDRVSSIGM